MTAKSLSGNIVSDVKMNQYYNSLVDLNSLLPIFTLPIVLKSEDGISDDKVIGIL